MKICLLGCDFFSDNRGCGALGYSALSILKKISGEKGEKLSVYAVVFHQGDLGETFADVDMRMEVIHPKKLSYWRNCLCEFKKCDFIIDFTGGDSFSDIYGFKRFLIATLTKQLAILSGRPFIMGPQTIGPFEKRITRVMAKNILKKTKVCFVRDDISGETAKKLAGINPVLTTDVAFSLPSVEKEVLISEKIKIGINPSGLLWYGSETFDTNKRLSVDYPQYVRTVIKALVESGKYIVYLIPHVFSSDSREYENDLKASIDIHTEFPSTIVISDFLTPMEAKGYISQMDVFSGARMHATIAAFSSGVATIPFSYSRKFEGLYNDLNYQYIVNGVAESTEDAVQKTLEWIENREEISTKVKDGLVIVKAKKEEFTDILRKVTTEEIK